MYSNWEVIYEYDPTGTDGIAIVRPTTPPISFAPQAERTSFIQILGFILLALGLGGMFGPLIPALRLESAYAIAQASSYIEATIHPILKEAPTLPPSAPVVFNPLVGPDGSSIEPVNREFSIIVPTVGINAPVIANVDPARPDQYAAALLQGVAHASTSFLPDADGTVYLFSHSTNYDWFVKDLNAVFYLLKNLKEGDLMVIYYEGKQYAYKLRETRVVQPSEISYLVPTEGKKSLILQTCWPPGSTTERLMLFADFVSEQ
jgi:LPXTG-site transpeptidase (sortase) family protein